MNAPLYWEFNKAVELGLYIAQTGVKNLIIIEGSYDWRDKVTGVEKTDLRRQMRANTVGAVKFCLDELSEEERKTTGVLMLANTSHSSAIYYNHPLINATPEEAKFQNILPAVSQLVGEEQTFGITYKGRSAGPVLWKILEASHIRISHYKKDGWGELVQDSFVSLPSVENNICFLYAHNETPVNFGGIIWDDVHAPQNRAAVQALPYEEREKTILTKLALFREECPYIVMPSAEAAWRVANNLPVAEGLVGARVESFYKQGYVSPVDYSLTFAGAEGINLDY